MLAEIREMQYLFQDDSPTFQASSFAGSKINLRKDPAFKSLYVVVVLLVRQKGWPMRTSRYAERTSKQSSVESFELAKLSNDLEDIVSRLPLRKLGARLDAHDPASLKRVR